MFARALTSRTRPRGVKTRVVTPSKSSLWIHKLAATNTVFSLQFDQCCAAENLALSSTVMTANPKADAIQAKCVTPGCTKKQVQNLASLQRRVNDLDTGTGAAYC